MTFPVALLAGVTALKSVDVAVRWSPAVGLAWCLGAILLLVRPRVGAGLVSGLAVWAVLGPLYGHNTTLLALLAAAFCVFGDREQRRFVVRHQLFVLYAFAAVAKLHGAWLSGAVIEALALPAWPTPRSAALAVVLVEAALAGLVWFPSLRRWWLPVAAALHLAFVFGVDDPSWASSGIISFGVLAVGMLWWSSVHDDRSGVPAGS